MNSAHDHRSVMAARQRFFTQGRRPQGLVSDTILRSWQRCAELGLEAAGQPDLAPLTAPALREVVQRHEVLRQVCRPELEALHAEARDTGCVVILTDADGLVLDTVGDTDFAGQAARVALRPGVPWGEATTGTNAIGTALVERRAVGVQGAEHYFEPHRILSCFAAPIVDPRGRVAGALDLSGHAAIPHMHALGMVRLAVDQIERRLFDDAAFRHCEVLRFHRDPALLGTAREGIAVFEDYRLVAANRHGLALLGLDWADLGQVRFSALFSSSLAALLDGKTLLDRRGQTLHGSIDRVAQLRTIAMPPPVTKSPVAVSVERMPEPEAAQQSLHRASRMLDAGLPVLIQGETGAGKEVFARALHRRCSRSTGPFVAVNCAALPEGLIESELFGYEDGAFTGARRRGAPGMLRRADGGVLFLDEIGDMPLSLQPRLLRVLQDRQVTPLGGGDAVAVDFALVCATHQDLRSAVEAGRFRADLYYRIAQHCVELPALRAHPDLPAAVRSLWHAEGGIEGQLPAEVISRLSAHDWPGNYRELAAVLRMLKVLVDDGVALTTEDLPASLRQPPRSRVSASAGALEQTKAAAMREALAACGGNVSAAARRLGISRSTLYRRVLESGAQG